jgi:hypothetical protein
MICAGFMRIVHLHVAKGEPYYFGVFFGPIGSGNWKKYSYFGLIHVPFGTSIVLSSSEGVALALDDVV